MKKLSLMSWSDSNIAGDDWTWFITLTVRKNGSYSIGAIQTIVEGPTYRLPFIYPLRKGRQVREAIEQLFRHDPLSVDVIDWEEIIDVLTNHAPKLAHEIAQSFIDDSIAEEASERQPPGPQIVANFSGGWNGAGGMVHSYNLALHKRAADWYVQRHFTDHGKWPRGEHTFTITYGKGEGFDVQTPIGTGSGTRTVTMTFQVYPYARTDLNTLQHGIPIQGTYFLD